MGADQEPQKSDLHHLYPCKSNVNSSRGNHPYSEIIDTETDTWYRNDYSQSTVPNEFIDEYAESLMVLPQYLNLGKTIKEMLQERCFIFMRCISKQQTVTFG